MSKRPDRCHSFPTDQQLMQQVQRRNSAALERLYDRYAGSVMQLALMVYSEQAMAETLVLEVYWHVWQRAEHFNCQQDSFSDWLLELTRDFVREERTRRKLNHFFQRPTTLVERL